MGHHFVFGLCIEIITLVIVLHFLAKVKKDELGKGLKWAGNILLILGFLAIACTLGRGVMGMMHCRQCNQQSECPTMGGHCNMHGGMMMHDGNGCCMHDGCCNHEGMMQDGKGCCMHDGIMKDGKACPMDSANGKKCPMCKDKEMGKEKMHNDTVKSIK